MQVTYAFFHYLSSRPSISEAFPDKAELRKDVEASGLEYTLVSNGLFLDYLLPVEERKYLKEFGIPVNSKEGTASIPGNEIFLYLLL
jgi:hypothetical protein